MLSGKNKLNVLFMKMSFWAEYSSLHILIASDNDDDDNNNTKYTFSLEKNLVCYHMSHHCEFQTSKLVSEKKKQNEKWTYLRAPLNKLAMKTPSYAPNMGALLNLSIFLMRRGSCDISNNISIFRQVNFCKQTGSSIYGSKVTTLLFAGINQNYLGNIVTRFSNYCSGNVWFNSLFPQKRYYKGLLLLMVLRLYVGARTSTHRTNNGGYPERLRGVFCKATPSSPTLLVWEKKTLATGSVKQWTNFFPNRWIGLLTFFRSVWKNGYTFVNREIYVSKCIDVITPGVVLRSLSLAFGYHQEQTFSRHIGCSPLLRLSARLSKKNLSSVLNNEAIRMFAKDYFVYKIALTSQKTKIMEIMTNHMGRIRPFRSLFTKVPNERMFYDERKRNITIQQSNIFCVSKIRGSTKEKKAVWGRLVSDISRRQSPPSNNAQEFSTFNYVGNAPKMFKVKSG
ncbi:hypothetical protein C0J52_09912 [Blattella germanica]|nr:hypothetical protein C0J52_09912 [Blattella germanica]